MDDDLTLDDFDPYGPTDGLTQREMIERFIRILNNNEWNVSPQITAAHLQYILDHHPERQPADPT